MTLLALVRHGQSVWNLENKFTGWVDVPLSEKGIKEALNAANKLKDITFDYAFTSNLCRAHETLYLILSKQKKTAIIEHKKSKKWWNNYKTEKNQIPIIMNDALNERYYGDLQGLNKDKTRKKYGKDQVHLWRRSYDIRPPNGECLKDTYKRSVPYFKKEIVPLLKARKNILISAHGNSLRAIIKFIEEISDEKIPSLEIPTGKPLLYNYSRNKFHKKQS